MGPHVEARIEGKSYFQTAGFDRLYSELRQLIEEMVGRDLREDPYLAHAAEVRENVIPRTELFQPTHVKLTLSK